MVGPSPGGDRLAPEDAATGSKPGELVEIEPGLRSLLAGNPGALTLDGTRTYLVGRRDIVVIDPGPSLRGHVARLLAAAAGTRVTAVCLTHAHPDHAGNMREVAGALRAPIMASASTLDLLAVVGERLVDGAELPVDGGDSWLRAVATPGHSADHTSYLWLPGRRLFTGDLVLGEGSSLVAHPEGSVADYLASLDRLVALRPSRLLPGHGPPVDNAVARLEAYRLHRLERDRQVGEAVREGARSVGEIQRQVYGALPEPLAGAARLSVLAHLCYLREAGVVLPGGLADSITQPPDPGLEQDAE